MQYLDARISSLAARGRRIPKITSMFVVYVTKLKLS